MLACTRENYFTLENSEGARFVTRSMYDAEVVGAPAGMLEINEHGGVRAKLSNEKKNEVYKLCKDIFRKNDERDIKVGADEIMAHVNRMFDEGFDNNVMHPRRIGVWP